MEVYEVMISVGGTLFSSALLFTMKTDISDTTFPSGGLLGSGMKYVCGAPPDPGSRAINL